MTDSAAEQEQQQKTTTKKTQSQHFGKRHDVVPLSCIENDHNKYLTLPNKPQQKTTARNLVSIFKSS